ncbi:hypothetical protein C8J56DRAFT_1161202 [Mycena floridula]|nr:hypothetical protein C8J56DRAFT_1161202 [Mycena floridula]
MDPPSKYPAKYLRILYTIDNSSQYTLARSHSLVPITLLNGDNRPQYASVSLKACLETICRSSPELVQDNSRDYSVYVFDPLESGYASAQTAASSSSALPQSTGVAVALGLMSWALQTDEKDSLPVTGTIITLGNGNESLEVFFSLRETAAMQKKYLPTALKSWGRSPHAENRSGASEHDANAAVRKRAEQKPKPKVPKPNPAADRFEADKWLKAPKLGRPKSTSAGENTSPSPPGTSGSTSSGSKAKSKRPTVNDEPSPIVTPKPPPDLNTSLKALSLPDLLALVSMSSGETRNAALSAALNAIDGQPTSVSTKDPATTARDKTLIEALLKVIATATNQNLAATSTSTSTPTSAPSTSTSTPSASTTTGQDEEIVVLDKENVNPVAFKRRGEKEEPKLGQSSVDNALTAPRGLSTISANTAIPSAPALPIIQPSISRKRTLSGILEEQHSRKRAPSSSLEKRGESSTSPVSDDTETQFHFSRVVYRETTDVSFSDRLPLVPCSSPPRSRPATSFLSLPKVAASSPVKQQARKPYVVPEWAKTVTATQPRLSAEKQAELEEKLKKEKAAAKSKKLAEKPLSRSKRKAEVLVSEVGSNSVAPNSVASNSVASDVPLPGPIMPSSDLPVFASTDDLPFIRPSSPPTSRTASPPRTPTRQRRANTIGSPMGALFTPSPRSWNILGSHSASPLFSPAGFPSPSKNVQNSPLRSFLGKRATSETRQIRTRAASPHPMDEDALTRDLESALEEMNQPAPSPEKPIDHWANMPSSPLPPSSPPPPMSQDLEMDDDVEMSPEIPGPNPEPAVSLNPDSFPGFGLLGDDYSALPPSLPSMNDDDIFDFLNFDPSSDSPEMIQDPVEQNGVSDLDFSQFWETVKPLVDEQGNTNFDGLADPAQLADDVRALFSGCLM